MPRAFLPFIFCFLVNLLWSQPCEINGLLIEGGGYTGKTTVCQLLLQRLDKQNVEYHHFILSNTALGKALLKQASQAVEVSTSAQLYAAGFIVDLVNFKPNSDAFYLQDRSWLSVLSMNKLFLQDSQLADYVRENRLSFRWNVLLTVNPMIKKERFAQREKRSVFNQYSHDHPEIQSESAQFTLEQIPNNENWLVIDTSHLAPNEIVEKILDFIK